MDMTETVMISVYFIVMVIAVTGIFLTVILIARYRHKEQINETAGDFLRSQL